MSDTDTDKLLFAALIFREIATCFEQAAATKDPEVRESFLRGAEIRLDAAIEKVSLNGAR